MNIDDAIADYQSNQQKPNIDQAISEYNSSQKPISVQNQIAGASLPGSSNEPAKLDPDFVTKLDVINTGVDRGIKNFSLAIMSKLNKQYSQIGSSLDKYIPGNAVAESNDRFQAAIKNADAQSTAANEYNKQTYNGYYPQIGEIGGEILATALLGGPLGRVISKAVGLGAGEAIAPSAAGLLSKAPVVGETLASVANSALPSALRFPVKYGLAGAGGVATNMALESQRYDPNNPGQLFNTDAASKIVSDPLSLGLSAGLPALGTSIGSWARKAGDVGAASELLGQGAIPRNVMEDGLKKTMYQSIFGFLPALTSTGAQVNELNTIGKPVWNFISKFADIPENMNFSDVNAKAGQFLKDTLNNVQKANRAAWNAGFKEKPVSDTAGVVSDVNKALGIMDQFGPEIPGVTAYKTLIVNTLKKVGADKVIKSPLVDEYGTQIDSSVIPMNKTFTVENVKNMQSNIGSAISKIKQAAGSNEITDKLSEIRDNLYNHMTNNLTPAEQADLTAARTSSKALYDLKNVSPLVKEAMVNEYSARKLLEKLRSPKEPIDKQKIFDIMSQEGKNTVVSEKLAEAFRASNSMIGFKIGKFIDSVHNDPDIQKLMTNDAFQNLNGLNTYLKNVQEANSVGWWKPAAVMAGAGVPAYLSGAGPLAGVAAIASLGAATFAANHPAFKYLFNGLSKKLPENTKNALQKAIGNHFSRAGYLIGADGAMRHKDEQPVQTGEQQQ